MVWLPHRGWAPHGVKTVSKVTLLGKHCNTDTDALTTSSLVHNGRSRCLAANHPLYSLHPLCSRCSGMVGGFPAFALQVTNFSGQFGQCHPGRGFRVIGPHLDEIGSLGGFPNRDDDSVHP
ncbi:hypothetical protein OUZ56_032878 [Daphnia magna]|uniref:Uncharacterized protein n=1 Tax=Daphnia magna TaxID=35525 RepID=A0ABR0B9T9_9CRUS|nr:hypothetical protein OUZ56_032878 [Daphnia magna]